MVAGVGIKEAEGFAPRGRVDYLVYARQRKRILWARFVETRVVNTHPPFPTLLLYKNGIGKPLWVVHFLDESGRQKLYNFLADGPAFPLVEVMQTFHQLGA